MRIRGRLGNPLLRRVQRHMHVATLFHSPPPEAGEEPGAALPAASRLMARPVIPEATAAVGTAFEPGLPGPEVSHAGEGRVQTQAAPAAAVPTAVVPSAVVPAAPTPMATPVAPRAAGAAALSAAPPAAAPAPAEPVREEDRTWKRLQAIMRKHQEKDEAEQAAQNQQEQPTPAAEPASAPPVVQRSAAASPPPAGGEKMAAPPPRPPIVEELTPGGMARPAPPPGVERSEPPAAQPVQPTITTPPAAVERPAAPPSTVTQAPVQRAAAPPSSAPPSQGPQPPAAATAPQVEPADSKSAAPPERPPVDAQAPTLIHTPRVQIPEPAAPGEPAPAEAPLERPAPAPLEASPADEAETLVQAKPVVRPPAEPPTRSQPLVAKAFPAGAAAGAAAEPERTADETVVQTRPAEGSSSPVRQLQGPPVTPAEPQAPPVESGAGRVEPPVSKGAAPTPTPQAVPPAVHPAPPPGEQAGTAAGAATQPAAPLQAVWPVERLEGDTLQRQIEPTAADKVEAEPVLPHDDRVGQILQSVAPGLASESHVELVTPRRPRPAAAAPAKNIPVQPPEPSPEVPQEAAQQAAEHSAPPAAPVVQRQPVETEIGALPADLWGLIGEKAPTGEHAPPAPVDETASTEALPPLPEAAQTIIAAQPPAARPAAVQLEGEQSLPTQPPPAQGVVRQPAAAEPTTGVPVQQPPAEILAEAAPSAGHAPRQSVLQRHLEGEEVQRKAAGHEPPPAKGEPKPLAPAASALEPVERTPAGEGYWTIPTEGVLSREPEMAEDVMQRAVQIDELTTEVTPAPASGGGSPDMDELAQKVYSEIKRRLAVEFERFRRR